MLILLHVTCLQHQCVTGCGFACYIVCCLERDVRICLGIIIVRYVNVINPHCEPFVELLYLILYFVVACILSRHIV